MPVPNFPLHNNGDLNVLCLITVWLICKRVQYTGNTFNTTVVHVIVVYGRISLVGKWRVRR